MRKYSYVMSVIKWYQLSGNLAIHIRLEHDCVKYECNKFDHMSTQNASLELHKDITHRGKACFHHHWDQCEDNKYNVQAYRAQVIHA